tara:strand:- start:40 stop:333 length:294 start_codon:yes stop_codon:yes gene_type:complete
MKQGNWSGYAKYLILADKSKGGLIATYEKYLDFIKVKDVINNIAYADKTTYSHEGDIYNRKVNSNEAKNILSNIEECKWTDVTAKVRLVANQLKIRI